MILNDIKLDQIMLTRKTGQSRLLARVLRQPKISKKCCKPFHGIFVLHPRILNIWQNICQHYEKSVPSSLLQRRYASKFKFFRNLLKNHLQANRGQLIAQIERNVFSNASERLFQTPSGCGKVKLVLNQQYIIKAQYYTPEVYHFLSKKNWELIQRAGS